MTDMIRALAAKLKAEEYVTLVFKCDIRSVGKNPFDVETPFGRARVCAMGDITDYADRLEDICHAFAEAAESSGLFGSQFQDAMKLYDAEFAPSSSPVVPPTPKPVNPASDPSHPNPSLAGPLSEPKEGR